MADALILVRHPPVTLAWQTRCYGQSDPGLSRAGQAMIAPLVDRLAAMAPDVIIHSDMKRTRAIAEPLGERLGIVPLAEPLWRERDFGAWEGQRWNAIYRATGDAMDGMVDAPETFRPGGSGETTQRLINRITAALAATPCKATVVVITHGGPIACARATQMPEEIVLLPDLIPSPASVTVISPAPQ
ncbi:broad specificity phosphatase PhoE [Novosphingobium hassiacum]|uniref:Broad specificity phosphatase PhoE n=1 Tax=Novosphingobium hassiacum TaxID=173676 RepID=A0A7W6EV46_9SPHN|nr:histidine phosphatase family protein [Novosphingobium hassiacum]MBB3859580.1 broad specificity phosphatase PhoE [Novosphingobium hassiacum]